MEVARQDLGTLQNLKVPTASGAVVEMHADPALPPVQADRGRLRQVLNTLITNGLEVRLLRLDAAGTSRLLRTEASRG